MPKVPLTPIWRTRSGSTRLYKGDVRDVLGRLPEQSVHCMVTSPPYWGLRDYGVDGQIGLEETPEEYVEKMVEVFREVRRVLRDDGTLWLNLGDSYSGSYGAQGHTGEMANRSIVSAREMPQRKRTGSTKRTGLKPKDLIGIPWRVALALQDGGWWLRSDIIWCKNSPMPESVRDRPTSAHEHIFLLTKSTQYFYDQNAERMSGLHSSRARNLWTYWNDLKQEPYPGAHFATFPSDLPRRCIRLGTSAHGACSECGAPWKRLVEKERVPTRPGNTGKTIAVVNGPHAEHAGTIVGNRDPKRHCTGYKTTGWETSCSCAGDVVPCTVLDPFLGSGTSCAVAEELGRYSIGIDVNGDYIQNHAVARIGGTLLETGRSHELGRDTKKVKKGRSLV